MHKNIDNSKRLRGCYFTVCSTSLALHQYWKMVAVEVVIITIWSASFSWRSAAAVSDSICLLWWKHLPHVDLETWPGVISAN